MIESLEENDLNQLAKDFVAGKVFTHLQCRIPEDIPAVFTPIALGGLSGMSEEDIHDIGLIYERLDKRGPLSVNGMPSFFSFSLLNKSDFEALRTKVDQIHAALNSIVPTHSEPKVGV